MCSCWRHAMHSSAQPGPGATTPSSAWQALLCPAQPCSMLRASKHAPPARPCVPPQAAAAGGESAAPSEEDEVLLHFVTFMHKDGRVGRDAWRRAGLPAAPNLRALSALSPYLLDRGRVLPQGVSQRVAAPLLLQLALVAWCAGAACLSRPCPPCLPPSPPPAGKLWQLDGRRRGPVCHGATAPGSLLQDTAEVVKQFVERSKSISFNLVALAPAWGSDGGAVRTIHTAASCSQYNPTNAWGALTHGHATRNVAKHARPWNCSPEGGVTAQHGSGNCPLVARTSCQPHIALI